MNFQLPQGQTVGIVGESGSGKSTFARVLSGLQLPTNGSVKYLDKPIQSGKQTYQGAMRKDVQMVFQDPYGSLNPRMRIVKAIAEAIKQHQPLDKKASIEAAITLLASMELAAMMHLNIHVHFQVDNVKELASHARSRPNQRY
ncbi:MAG: ATP-binding cassette domain-containing protein [Actinomycetota bacterium]